MWEVSFIATWIRQAVVIFLRDLYGRSFVFVNKDDASLILGCFSFCVYNKVSIHQTEVGVLIFKSLPPPM